MEPMLTTRDMMTLLRVGAATLWRMLAAGRLPAPMRIGGRGKAPHRWRAEEIRAWIEAGMPDRNTWEKIKR